MTTTPRSRFHFAYFSYEDDEQALVSRNGFFKDLGQPDVLEPVQGELRFPLGEEKGIVGWVARSARPVYVADCTRDDRWIDLFGARSAFFVPLALEGPCDVLVVLSRATDGIGAHERELAESLVRYLHRAGRSAGLQDARVRRFERGLRRIALELSELGVEAASPGQGYPPDLAERLRLLSAREWEVLERLRSGLRVATIARELGISPNTVRNHLKSVYRKLGVRSQIELLEALRDEGAADVRPEPR